MGTLGTHTNARVPKVPILEKFNDFKVLPPRAAAAGEPKQLYGFPLKNPEKSISCRFLGNL